LSVPFNPFIKGAITKNATYNTVTNIHLSAIIIYFSY